MDVYIESGEGAEHVKNSVADRIYPDGWILTQEIWRDMYA